MAASSYYDVTPSTIPSSSSSSSSSRLPLAFLFPSLACAQAPLTNTTKNDSPSPSLSPASYSSSPSPSSPPSSFSPHSTCWSQVDLFRFSVYMSIFSTAENAVFYPFYVIKTLEQSDRSTSRKPFESTRYHLHKLLKHRGFGGLYRGFMTSNLTALPAYGVYMGMYTWTKDTLGYNSSAPSLASLYAPLVAGFVADAASVALYVPGDVVVQRLQIHNSPYTGFFDACVKIANTDGIKGFYQGFGATFLTSGVASALWWLIYENSKTAMYKMGIAEKSYKQNNDNTSVHSSSSSSSSSPSASSLWLALTEVNRVPQFLSGFIAGTLTSTAVNPLDVVKTRLQVQDAHRQTYSPLAATDSNAATKATKAPAANSATRFTGAPVRYKNVFHGLYRLYQDEGMRGYFRGVVPKLISRGPLSAFSSILYELTLYLSRKESTTTNNATHNFG